MCKRIFLVIIILFSSVSSSFMSGMENEFKIKKVVIDAGHGGKDSGCISSGRKIYEKEVALAIALKLGKYISEKLEDVEVIYTRKTDEFIELHKRADIANKNNADFFICIHCNSSKKAVFGTETYVMGLHVTEDNLSVAKRENASVLMEKDYKAQYDGFDPNSPEANIVFSMYQNAHLDQSIELAARIQNQFETKAKRHNRGVKQAGFLVLYKTTMPSVLIETGFLTNQDEEKLLASEEGQDIIASAIFRAFRDYKQEMEGLPIAGNSLLYEKKNSEVSFKVQIFTSSQPVPIDGYKFDSIRDFGVEEHVADGWYKYTVGNVDNLKSAYDLKAQVGEKGFTSAFVIAFNNGIRIPIKEALQLSEK